MSLLTQRITTILAGATLLVAARIATAHDNGWVRDSDPVGYVLSANSDEDVDVYPEGTNLCEGILANPFGGDPGWVRVSGNPRPDEPFAELSGQVLPSFAMKGNPYIAHTDNPFNHYMMDLTVFVLLDWEDRWALGNGGNFGTGEENEHGMLEVEWERGGLPLFAWPSAGDRVTMWGHHVWDCGHSDTGHRTEMHPPVGWVVYRQTASRYDRDTTPPDPGPGGGPGKRDQEPWIWYQHPDSDRQGIGATFPTYSTYDTPIQATVADVFFSSFGANAIEAINGCDDDGLANLEYRDATCYVDFGDDFEWASAVLNQDYTFFIPAPPMPVSTQPMIGDPFLIYEEQDRCGGVNSNPGNPGNDAERIGEADDGAVNIGAPTCNTIPALVEETTEGGLPGIRVTVQANSGGVSYPANNYIVFAKTYRVGWDYVPDPGETARSFQTTFERLKVWDDADECGGEGEWVMSLRVNEKWVHPVDGVGEGGIAFFEEDAIDDDKAACGGDDLPVFYTINDTVTNMIVPGEKLEVFERSFDLDVTANNYLPFVHFETDQAGSYTIGEDDLDIEGAHELEIAIVETTPAKPQPGVIVNGGPSYGPNADTGGSLRIGANTDLSLGVTDADELQFREWPQADPSAKPGTWLRDTTPPLQLDPIWLDGDGRHVFEYRPAFIGSQVNLHRTLLVELDTTPPVLDVPADISLPATEAAGRAVDFDVAATDSIPGPVDWSCDFTSGDFFPIRHVTPVTCTATDAVGNSVTKTFNVDIYSPFGYPDDYVALGRDWVEIGKDVVVQTGNVGANVSSVGVPQWAGVEAHVDTAAQLVGGPVVAAETVRLEANVDAGSVFALDPIVAAASATYTEEFGCYVPLFLGMPFTAPFVAGGSDMTIHSNRTLAAGSYGVIDVKPNKVLTLSGGDYYFTQLKVGAHASVRASAPSIVHVTGRVSASQGSFIGPTGAVAPHDLTIWVAGTDGQGNSGTAFETAHGVTVHANVSAFNGTLTLGVDNDGVGAFQGKGVRIGNDTTLVLDSAMDYPYP